MTTYQVFGYKPDGTVWMNEHKGELQIDDNSALRFYDDDDGNLIHAYSPNSWAEVKRVDEDLSAPFPIDINAWRPVDDPSSAAA